MGRAPPSSYNETLTLAPDILNYREYQVPMRIDIKALIDEYGRKECDKNTTTRPHHCREKSVLSLTLRSDAHLFDMMSPTTGPNDY